MDVLVFFDAFFFISVLFWKEMLRAAVSRVFVLNKNQRQIELSPGQLGPRHVLELMANILAF